MRKKQAGGQVDPRKICSLSAVFKKMKQNKKLNRLWNKSRKYRKKVFDYFAQRYGSLTIRDYNLIVR